MAWNLRNLWVNFKWWVYWRTIGIGEEKRDLEEYNRLYPEFPDVD